jgi:hypothetical protein
MIFSRPLPYKEALESQQSRRWLPTTLTSGELARLQPALLRRSMFSAKVSDFAHLDEIGTGISDVLSGQLDVATARLRIRQHLWRTGYQAPPDKVGGLEDLASEARVNLQIDTNVAMMRGLGNYIQGQQEDILDMYPAQRLVRVIDSKEKRDWEKRWSDAGGPESTGDVALKTDPVWVNLSRFRNPYPPFDYNSGMDVEDVSRREAMALGLIDLNTQLFPDRTTGDINQGVQAAHAVQDKRLKSALEKSGIGRFDESGVFVLAGEDSAGAAPLRNREYARDENGRFASKNAGALAVEAALQTKADVKNAMERPDVGIIDFRWGNDRMGLAHIIKRGDDRAAKFGGPSGAEVLRKMPEVLAEGKITERGDRIIMIEHGGYRAVLAKQWKGKDTNHWLLSGYDLDEKKKGNR